MAHAMNILALFLGFFGSLLIWKYGVPPDINRGGMYELGIGNDNAMNKRVICYRRLNSTGLLMLAAAFGIQLAALLLPTTKTGNSLPVVTAQPATKNDK